MFKDFNAITDITLVLSIIPKIIIFSHPLTKVLAKPKIRFLLINLNKKM